MLTERKHNTMDFNKIGKGNAPDPNNGSGAVAVVPALPAIVKRTAPAILTRGGLNAIGMRRHYLIDRSGSMGEMVPGEWPDDYYNIDEETVRLFFTGNDDEPWTAAFADSPLAAQVAELKKRGLTTYYTGVTAKDNRRDVMSRIAVARQAVLDAVKKVFSEHAEAEVNVTFFNSTATPIVEQSFGCEDRLQGLADRLGQIHATGTTSYEAAFNSVLSNISKRDSVSGTHHVVVIGDGEDEGLAYAADRLIECLKAARVTVDFVYIGTPNKASNGVKALERLCSACGGTFTSGGTREEFTQKYLTAASRLLTA